MDGSGHGGDMPIPITSAYLDGHDSPLLLHHRHPSNGPPPPPFSEDHHSSYSTKKAAAAVKYRECLKNHAASIGGNATDGCGEFMPSGEEGTLEALKCSACGCHRNFHRKETDGEEEQEPSPLEYLPPLSLRGSSKAGSLLFPRAHHPMIMPLQQTSESNEMMAAFMRPPPPPLPPHLVAKRRFRTKFTAEQKEKMLGFAEKVEWRLQREQEGLVQQFCQEIGVKRRVFKVWMHNNKHNFAKKNNSAPPISGSSLNIDH